MFVLVNSCKYKKFKIYLTIGESNLKSEKKPNLKKKSSFMWF